MFTTMLGVAIQVGIGWGGTPAVWHSDYAQAHDEACNSDKPLFIVICSKSSEYGQMASLGIFLSDTLEKTLQADYVRFLIDTDTPDGQKLAKQFDAGDAPHFVILDRSGKWQVFYQAGYLMENDLVPVLAKHRRIKLTAAGKVIQEVAQRPVVRTCST